MNLTETLLVVALGIVIAFSGWFGNTLYTKVEILERDVIEMETRLQMWDLLEEHDHD